MKRLVLGGLWATAIVSLSRLIALGKTSVGLSLAVVAQGGFWLALLLGAMFVLTLRMYALEQRAGRVTRPVGVFERILERGAAGAH